MRQIGEIAFSDFTEVSSAFPLSLQEKLFYIYLG